jgi:hypothetical protein
MSWKTQLPFVAFFLFVIYSVGIIQAVYELSPKEGEPKDKQRRVQFLDVFGDTFITPVKRKNSVSWEFDKLLGKLDGLDSMVAKRTGSSLDDFWYSFAAEQKGEEALSCAQDIRNTALTINRHLKTDETKPFFVKLDSLESMLQDLYETLQDEGKVSDITDRLAGVRKRAGQMRAENPTTRLYEMPGLAFEAFLRHTVFSRKYLRAYQSEMEESSVAANTLRPPTQFVRFALFHDLGSKAVLGRNGWYFYKPGFDYLVRPYMRDRRSIIVDPNDVPLVENPLEAIVKFKKQLDERGIELLVVIVPGKASIYPEMLNARADPELAGTRALTHSLRAIDDLRELGVECVDLFTPFGEEKKRDAEAGDSMYLKMDTHWRARGVRLAAKTVAARVRQYPWFGEIANTADYVLDTVVVDRVGDVGVMTTLPAFSVRELGMAFPVEKATCYQVYQVHRDEEGNEVRRSLFRDDYRNAKILVLGDSFSRIYQSDEPRGAGWISHLACELSVPLASIVSDGGASTLVRQTLARRVGVLRGKELVIWEFIERDFRYGAKGWKDVEL